MNPLNPIFSGNPNQIFPLSNPENQQSKILDFTSAREAYIKAVVDAEERHAEIGILLPDGLTIESRLGKDEPYGAHRVGSATKTFTTFLALKLTNDNIKLKNSNKIFGLDTKCGELIDKSTLSSVFNDPDAAEQMTLDQLLSHTSGLEYDDHNREKGGVNAKTIDARFRYEAHSGNKYKHVSKPGDDIGLYSNAGLAVAAWMIEIAYNQNIGNKEVVIPFSQIIKIELFDKVFHLSEDTFIAPGPTGDIIASAAGDMTSSIKDLLKVAKILQEGEDHLSLYFGANWHKKMLAPRDLFEHHGLGCSANASSIQHYGLNSEVFKDGKLRDVTAVVIFPLGKQQPGLVAMCDSNALGPLPHQQAFANELQKLAGIKTNTKTEPQPNYLLDFFCPSLKNACFFKGDAYVITDVDPFSAPHKINCSRNGMRHELTRKPIFDSKGSIGYQDSNGKKWMMITKEDRKLIYSEYCLVNSVLVAPDLTQPSPEKLKAIEGTYYDANDNLTYNFKEKDGHLYFQEGNDQTYPALYLPKENFWVVSLPAGRKNIKFRFPVNPDKEPLIIVDISRDTTTAEIANDDRLPPFKSIRKSVSTSTSFS